MTNYGRIKSAIKPEEKVIDEYSVWVSTDIQEVKTIFEDATYTEYEFNQVQYSKDEYIKMIDDKNTALESQVTDTQIALCEVFELVGG